jgi:hypothetical protein
LKRYLLKFFIEKPVTYQYKVIGLIILLFGIIFFYNPTILRLKIGIMFVLIGGFVFLLLTDTKSIGRLTNLQMVLLMSFWIIFLFFIPVSMTLEMYLLMIFLGITAIRELTNELISDELKKNLNLFFFFFFVIVIAIVVKILNVFNI